jgi:DNA modification methylase
MPNLDKFKKETTTLWSFPERGNWATHNPKFRGNFAPQIARNIILKYSEENDTVLDPMVGGGTTLIEAKLLNRQGIGFDINPEAVKLTRKCLQFDGSNSNQKVEVGDARNLAKVKDESIDLILTHPPYINIIKYSNGEIKQDLSNISSPIKFCNEFESSIREFYRVLKPGKYCAILIGDTRKSRHYVPLAFYVMQLFFKNKFILKEDIIKYQHNCESTPYWKAKAEQYNIYLIMHEHLFVFRKPEKDEDVIKFRYSRGLF